MGLYDVRGVTTDIDGNELFVSCDKCRTTRGLDWISAYHGDCGGTFRADSETWAKVEARNRGLRES